MISLKKFKNLFFCFSLLTSCWQSFSVGDNYEDLIGKTVTLKKPMTIGFVEKYAGKEYLLIDHTKHFWSQYKTVMIIGVDQKLHLTDIECVITEAGKQYWFVGEYNRDGNQYKFHYQIRGEPSKQSVEDIWYYGSSRNSG